MGWDLRLYLHCDVYLSGRTGCCQKEGQEKSQEAGQEAGREAGRKAGRHTGLSALPPHPTLPTVARCTGTELRCTLCYMRAAGWLPTN